MQISKECFMNIMASFALPKGSSYTTSVSEGYVCNKVVHHRGGKMMRYVCRIIEMNAFEPKWLYESGISCLKISSIKEKRAHFRQLRKIFTLDKN